MADVENFKSVFGSNASAGYDQHTITQIARNRRSLENELFIDRLLKALGVNNPSKYYPPDSHDKFKQLHERIISSPSPDHHKHSVLYYLLKDLPHTRHSPIDFAQSTYLPEKYKIFIDGIWFLDRLKLEKALDNLTTPTLTPTFPSEILTTLCHHSHDPTLPIAYYQTVSPPLTPKALETYFHTLCRASLTEAYSFSSAQGEPTHRLLFENLISFVLTQSTGGDKAAKGVEMLNLPLDKEEQGWFEAFLREGKARELPGAVDTLIMRAIALGRPDAIAEFGGKGGRMIGGVNWGTLKSHVQSATARRTGRGVQVYP